MTRRYTNWLQDGNGSFEPANQGAEQYAVAEPIEGRLGQVGVDDTGALAGVDLNESAMRTMRADSVAHFLVAAINRAQDSATTQRSRRR